MILALLRIKARMSADMYHLLKNYISPMVDSENETGWEESTLASIQHLLKKFNASGSKANVGMTKMQELSDTSKLKSELQ